VDEAIPDDLSSRLEPVLHNLVGNAIKFTAEGTVPINGEARDERVEVSVSSIGS